MRVSRPFAVSAALATVGGLGACQPFEAPGPAVIMSPAVPFLSSEVDRALRSVRGVRGAPTANCPDARGDLDEAEAALVRLQTYYLPLLEARQRASNARQHAANGELEKANGELGQIETILLTLARSRGEEMGRLVEDPLDLLEEARVALTRSSPQAPARLEDLAERLELMLLKGDLVLE